MVATPVVFPGRRREEGCVGRCSNSQALHCGRSAHTGCGGPSVRLLGMISGLKDTG